MRPGRAKVRVQSYRLVLPAPWVRIPLRQGTEETVRRLVDRVAESTPKEIPPDQVGPKKRELVRTLTQRAAALRDKGGLDLYIPLDTIHGFVVRASFTVSETMPAGADAAESGAVLGVLLDEPGTTSHSTRGSEVHGLPGTEWVRRQRVIPAQEETDPAVVVDYTTAIPGAEHVWLVCSFSVVGSDAEDPDSTARPLVDLFDAIMTTWRWELAP